MRNFVFVLAMLGISVAQAATVTVDFDEFTENNMHSPIVSDGYSFDSRAGFEPIGGIAPCPICTLTISNVAGDPFSLLSLGLWNVELFGTGDAVVTVTGNYAVGGQVSIDLLLPASIQTDFSFDSAWSGLQSATFSAASTGSAVGYDNVVLSAVPIPAAVWLFGSALAGLGWMRRKQTG